MSKRTTRFSLLEHLNRSRRAARGTKRANNIAMLESLEPRAMLTTYFTNEDTPVIINYAPDIINSVTTDPPAGATNGTIQVLTAGGTPGTLGVDAVQVRFTPAPNFFSAPNGFFVLNTTGGVKNDDVNVASINDAPAFTGTGGLAVNENTAGAPTSVTTTSVQVNDVDLGSNLYGLVTLTATSGKLTLLAPPGGTTGNATSSVSIPAGLTQAQLNTALAGGIKYEPNQDFNGGDTIVITALDNLGNPGTGNIGVTVGAVNSPPVIAGNNVSINEDTASAANFAAIAISDVDANPTTEDLQVVLSLNQGGKLTLTAGSGGAGGVPAGDIIGNNSASITLTGTQQELAVTIGTLIYQGALNFNGVEKLTVFVNDLGHGPGAAKTNTKVIDITVNAVNDGPVLTVPGAQTASEQVTLGIGGVSVADLDALAGLITVGVSTSGGGLVAATSAGGATVANSGTTSMSITGTLPAVNATLASLNYTSPELLTAVSLTDVISIGVNDNGNTGGGALTDSKTVNVTVSPVNDAPVVTLPTSYSRTEDAASSVLTPAIAIADADLVGNSILGLSVTISVNQGGTLKLTNTTGVVPTTATIGSSISFTGPLTALPTVLAALEYQPAANFNGTETLTVFVSDNGNFGSGGVKTHSASTPINVGSVNDPPQLTLINSPSFAVTVLEDTGAFAQNIVSSVTPGPANEAGQSVTLSLAAAPASPLFSVQPAISSTGVLTFTPAANQFGSHVITVLATDNGSPSAQTPQSFTINITGVNDAPTFTAVSPPVANQLPGAQPFTNVVVVTSASPGPGESNAMTVEIVSVSNPGLFSSVPTLVSTTPSGGNASINYTIAPNGLGSSTVQLRITDNGGTANGGSNTSVTQSIVIQVSNVNQAPVFGGPTTGSTPEETQLEFKAANGNKITLADPDAGPNLIQLSLQVLDQTIPPGGPLAGKGILTLGSTAGVAITAGANGSKSMTLLGTPAALENALEGLKYLPPLNFVSAPNPALNDIIRLTANDLGNSGIGGAQSSVRNISVTVTPVNDPVTLTVLFPDVVDNEDTTGTVDDKLILIGNSPFVGSSFFADVDASDPSPQIVGLSVSSSNNTLVTGSIDPAGVLKLNYGQHQSGTATITVTATDAFGSVAADTFQVTINPINTAVFATSNTNFRPVSAVSFVTESVGEDFAPLQYNLRSQLGGAEVFGDFDLPNETHTFSATTNPSGIVTVSFDTSTSPGKLIISPVANQFGGPVEVIVTAQDSAGATAQAKIFVSVSSVNDAPVANPDTVNILEDAAAVTINVLTNDTPGPANESSQTVQVNGIGGTGPANGTAVASPGSIAYTPNPGFYGQDTFTYQIIDNLGAVSGFGTVTVNVAAVNDAPSIASVAGVTFNEDVVVPLNALIIQVSDDTLSGIGPSSTSVVTLDLTAGHGTIVIDPVAGVTVTPIAGGQRLQGQVTLINASLADPDSKYTPNLDFNTTSSGAPTETLAIVVNDGGNISATNSPVLTATKLIPFTIQAVNDNPTLVLNPSPVNVPQHTTVGVQTFTFNGFVSQLLPAGHLPTPGDEAGQTVTYSLSSWTNHALIPALTLNTSTGQLVFDTASNGIGSSTVFLNVNDNAGGFTSQSFTINVGINQAPLFDLVGNAVSPVQDINVGVSSGTSQFPNFLRNVETGPAGTDSPAGQVIQSVSVTNDNNALFTAQPQIINFAQPASGHGDLIFSVVGGASGVANVTVTLTDSGGTSNGGTNSTSKTFKITVGSGSADVTAPRVTDVKVGGSAWQSSFLAQVGGVGYSIPDGGDQAKALPWSNINRVYVDFNEPVKGSGLGGALAPIDMALWGTNSGIIVPSSVSYDALNNRATLILTNPLAADKYLLAVDDINVTDNAGNKLDGEWTNYSSVISGNGAAGGQLLYRFNVLPGDANQSASVSISDLASVAATFGAVAGGSSYSVLRDVNASGTISISDLAIVASAFGSALPAGNPLGIPSIAASVDSVFDNTDETHNNGATGSSDIDATIDSIATSVSARGKSRGAFLA